MNKLLKSVLISSSIFASYSAQAATCTQDIIAADIAASTGSTNATICGQQVSWAAALNNQELVDIFSAIGSPGDTVLPGVPGDYQIIVNGQVFFAGTTLTQADKTAFLLAIGYIEQSAALASTSLASTSASSKVSDTIFNTIINPAIQTRTQQQQSKTLQKLIVSVADLKYERAQFTDTNDKGNIGGFTASASYDINEKFSFGAVIPYDYLSFNTFQAHRTGVIIYAKNTLKLPSSFELSTAINGNAMYTASQDRVTNRVTQLGTFGGGFSTRLKFDNNNSNFVPSVAFSYQYNQDSTNIQDNYQHLIKLGPSLGYRVLDNATIQVAGSWTKDISQYKQLQNGNDFYDVGVEGTWLISDEWQLRSGYKKVLGLTNFESDSFYLGSSLKF
ncbi:hypothetical protein BCS42_13105 [Crenothrix sp. D3]|nr:hypothetical protein BCS42_13105 [Crenothrix sp. D3]